MLYQKILVETYNAHVQLMNRNNYDEESFNFASGFFNVLFKLWSKESTGLHHNN